MNLLIVEDNYMIRRLLKSMVADLASAVYECSDGADALSAYVEYHPDFVLMDIAMKELDGIAATQQIKKLDPAAKIIIVTSFDAADLREAARAAGACGYLLKENLFDVRRLLHAATV